MKYLCKAWTVSLLSIAALSCAPAVEEDGLVLLEVQDDPTVTLKVWFQVGSQDDPVGKEGLVYLTAQMLAEASTKNNTLEQIQEKLYPMAAGYSISVDREMTVLGGRTHKDNLPAYFQLFTEAYLAPGFVEEDFERIKADTLNYLRNSLRYQADEELGKAALYGFVFEGTRYAHPPQGTVQGVESVTLDDVLECYRTNFTRERAVMALGGGVEEEWMGRFRESRQGLVAGSARNAVPVSPNPIKGNQLLLVSKPDADASISFGFPIDVRRGDREFYALWIANSWLGEHRNSSSHLYQVIREQRGLNYGDYSYIEAFTNGGRRNTPPSHVARNQQIFEVWIRTLPNEQAHFALRAALRELKGLVENGMSEQQFELTRSFLRKYVLHFADTTRARLAYAVDDRFYGIEDEGHLKRFREMLDEITHEEVNAAIRKHLRIDDVKIAIVTGQAESLGAALVADLPSPISYASPKAAEVLAEDEEISTFSIPVEQGAVRIVPVEEIFQR